jgi:chromosome segregation ATPase
MKTRIGLIALIAICLALGIALLSVRKSAAEQKRQDTTNILSLSNNWLETTGKLREQQQVTALLEKDLDSQKQTYTKALGDLTNDYIQVSSALNKTEASLKSAQEDIVKRDQRISKLESDNQALDKQALDLSSAITNLNTQIADVERKLKSSEGEKTFLQGELKRLMAEKADLERQFNDLAVLRAQVSKLKEELSIARRLDWIRKGLFANSEQKGAQMLMNGFKEKPKPAGTNFDLNVELQSEGGAKIVAPTNAPAASPK